MSKTEMPALVAKIIEQKRIDAGDVLALRREIYADGIASRIEAEWLFAIDAATGGRDAAFTALFVEAIADYLVWQETPTGRVTDEGADWLLRQIAADGQVNRASELALLAEIIEDATSVPPELAAFALHEVKRGVITGEGPAVSGRSHASRMVDAEDVALMTRILHGAGGEGGLAVTRAEAEMLFEIADAVAESPNDPAFDLLFVRAIANHLLASQPRRVAIDGERPSDVLGLTDLLKRALDAARSPHRVLEGAFAERNAQAAADASAAAVLSDREAAWLEARILADGRITDAERALLAFVRREAGSIDRDARARLSRVA